MTPEQLAAMEQVLADLNKHYPYEDESGIIKLSLGRFMNARENLRTIIEQAKRQQALDKMAENERELGIQMQPEPVAYRSLKSNGSYSFCLSPKFFDNAEPLYTHPAPAAPVQEPVALCCGHAYAAGTIKWNPFNGVVQCHNCGQTYTTPPAAQRQWAGLTDDEIVKVLGAVRESISGNVFLAFARAIEAKLRERNRGAS